MTALNERQIQIVRTLVETAPDKVVGSLRQALADTAPATALGGVRRLVEAEVADRTLRNMVLQPIAPMCVTPEADSQAMTFPPRVLGLIWRALRETSPHVVEQLRNDVDDESPPHTIIAASDLLAKTAAAGLRAREVEGFRVAAELCDQARPGGAEVIAACLDMAHVVRRAIARLPDWLAHSGGETTAGARLAFRDAVHIAEDAGSRFFQMLAAQLPHPWMVLRVISAVMDKPTERYMADSELAGFAEDLMADIDRGLNLIGGLKADDGVAAAKVAAQRVELVVQQFMEIETSLELAREHGWGLRVHKQRASLAAVVEGRLRDAGRVAEEALPMMAPRQRSRRSIPRFAEPPQPRAVERATTMLSFAEALHGTANYGGFSAGRNKLIEGLGGYIDAYVDEAVDMIRTGEAEELENAEAFLGVAGGFIQHLRGGKAGDLVRRRAHAALHPDQPPRMEDWPLR
ncbi:MAG: hypothetical protein AB1942_09370 [Pseudomonadota bacterium]